MWRWNNPVITEINFPHNNMKLRGEKCMNILNTLDSTQPCRVVLIPLPFLFALVLLFSSSFFLPLLLCGSAAGSRSVCRRRTPNNTRCPGAVAMETRTIKRKRKDSEPRQKKIHCVYIWCQNQIWSRTRRKQQQRKQGPIREDTRQRWWCFHRPEAELQRKFPLGKLLVWSFNLSRVCSGGGGQTHGDTDETRSPCRDEFISHQLQTNKIQHKVSLRFQLRH